MHTNHLPRQYEQPTVVAQGRAIDLTLGGVNVPPYEAPSEFDINGGDL